MTEADKAYLSKIAARLREGQMPPISSSIEADYAKALRAHTSRAIRRACGPYSLPSN